jgi:hypothetical protein
MLFLFGQSAGQNFCVSPRVSAVDKFTYLQLTESRAERISPGAENRLKIQCLLLKINSLAWPDPRGISGLG